MERETIEAREIRCPHSDEEIAKSFIEDVEAVKGQLPCNQMDFPETFDEFARDYGFRDKEEIYTNGSELIPVFRVKQWLEHIKKAPCEDAISRQALINAFPISDTYTLDDIIATIKFQPSVVPKGVTVTDFADKCRECGKQKKGEALEQEPEHLVNESGDLVKDLVKDAISRQAVLSKIKEVCFSKEWLQFRVDNGSNGQRDFLINHIEQLPPVIPTRKKGKWIYDKIIQNWRCSECNETPKTPGFVGTADFMAEHFRFCNHCGAEMEN